jgi:hypothetical protein
MKKLMIVFLFIPILGFAQTKMDIFNPDVPLVFLEPAHKLAHEAF